MYMFLSRDLLPPSVEMMFALVWEQAGTDDPFFVCKYFEAKSETTIYATEYDPKERKIIGLIVQSNWVRRSRFSLDEMEKYSQTHGTVWLDLMFKPCYLSELRK